MYNYPSHEQPHNNPSLQPGLTFDRLIIAVGGLCVLRTRSTLGCERRIRVTVFSTIVEFLSCMSLP